MVVTTPFNNRSARQAVRGHTATWTPILAAYSVYLGLALFGYLIGHDFLVVGGMLFVLTFVITYGQYLQRTPVTPLTIGIIFAGLLPLIAVARSPATTNLAVFNFLVKHYAFFLIILISTQLPLRPLPRCRQSRWVYGAIVAALVISLVHARLTGGVLVDERVSGMFANPNNLALMALCLLCFIDDASSWSFRWATHGLVIVLLLLSGTAGAIVGYAVGRGYQLIQSQRSAHGVLILCSIVAMMIVLPLAFAPVLLTYPPIRSLATKIDIAVQNIPLALEGHEINYWHYEQEAGEGTASGLWRLAHWRKTLVLYAAGSLRQQVFGFGIGTSEMLLEKKPHNDYLRVLFELGIAGSLALAVIWGHLFWRMAPASRWVFVAVATYSFTENNADNFLAMSLFALFVVSAAMYPRLVTATHPASRVPKDGPDACHVGQ
ncbi:MAG TPA: hypothetical protein VGL77_15455 [Armatimonadota bacterium]|jgi:hypothetical protein